MARARITVIDWVMLALALVSVALVVYETWGHPSPEDARQIRYADYVIIGIFAVEFAVRWAKDDRPRTFLWRNWYDLLGMIPVSHPAVRGFRLFRLVRIVIILSRFGRAADRAFGEEFTYRLLRRFKDTIAAVVADAVTVRVLDETMAVMERGAYARNVADHLEQQGDQFTRLVVEKLQADPALGKVRHLPFFDDVVAASSRAAQRLVVDVLRDPRTDRFMKDLIRRNVEQIRDDVKRRDAARDAAEGIPPAPSSTPSAAGG